MSETDGNLALVDLSGNRIAVPWVGEGERLRMGVNWLPSLTGRRVPLRELGMKIEDPALLGCDLGRTVSHCEEGCWETQ